MKYKIIYADPPWKFNNKNTGGSMKSGALNKYPVMSINDLKSLDIESICEPHCVLVMWWVSSQPQEAIDLCHAWGFTIKSMNGFIWNKLTKKSLPFFGMGFYTRAGAEAAIIAVKGKPKIMSHSVRQVRSAVVGRHSEKPSKFREDIINLCGDIPRLEMFARQKTEGWDVFGNEVKDSITIPIKGENKCQN